MSTDCIVKCSSRQNECCHFFCHITWSMHSINLLQHHIIMQVQLLCALLRMPMLYVWQWTQHVYTFVGHATAGQARQPKCDKACSAQRHMHTQPCIYILIPFHLVSSTPDPMTVRVHSWPHPLLMHTLYTLLPI